MIAQHCEGDVIISPLKDEEKELCRINRGNKPKFVVKGFSFESDYLGSRLCS